MNQQLTAYPINFPSDFRGFDRCIAALTACVVVAPP
jgi:hypothetical protein